MAEIVAIGKQAEEFARTVDARMRSAGVRAVNHGAQLLAKLARGAARGRSYANTSGKRLPMSIMVRRCVGDMWPATARVFIDTQRVPHAGYVHENYSGYRIVPRVKKYIYSPLTAAGRRHELYANDAEAKGLRGWLSNGQKSMPVGYWNKAALKRLATSGLRGIKLDYVLTKSVRIPPNPRAGFLTGTATSLNTEIAADIRATFREAMAA